MDSKEGCQHCGSPIYARGVCNRHYQQLRRQESPDLFRAQESRRKGKVASDPEKTARSKEYKRQYYAKNREAYARKMKARYEANKAEYIQRAAIWNKANRGVTASLCAKRRANALNATPAWLTRDQKAEIRIWYNLAKELQWLSDEPLHVDHIVPLQGEIISGLHVPWNLQILPRTDNIRKGNKL